MNWEHLQEMGMIWGVRVIGFVLVLVIGVWVAKLVCSCLVKGMNKKGVDSTLTKFLSSLALVGMKTLVVVVALGVLKIPIASFVTILGAAGLAIGLALQGSLSNFASGVLMIIFRPFTIGDFIEAGGATGVVQEISIFTTTINSPDNKKIIVPNAGVMGGTITNFNANGTRRVDLVAGISYNDDIDKAKAILMDVLAADERILKDPLPNVAVVEMADSSVNLVVRPWCTGADYWDVYFGVNEAIKKAFDKEGISIPFPQRDVHVYEHKEG